MARNDRVIRDLVKAVKAVTTRYGSDSVSFQQIKEEMNNTCKWGITSPRLANFLSKRREFKFVRQEFAAGTVITYWALAPEVMQ